MTGKRHKIGLFPVICFMNDAVSLLLPLLAAIAFIVWGTARRNLNAFFVLLLAAIGTGALAGMPLPLIAESVKTGFGDTMSKIGIIILLGTALGVLLEKTRATHAVANFILEKVGKQNAPAANSVTGFTVGLSIFCDSGFIILSGLNRAMTRLTRFGMPVMATTLATALYAVHCLVPPHPGIAAACGSMNADLGKVMLLGLLVALPSALAGYFWATKIAARFTKPDEETVENQTVETAEETTSNINPLLAALPVLLPIVLIGLKSFLLFGNKTPPSDLSWGLQIVAFAGEPAIALLLAIGAALVFLMKKNEPANNWLTDGIVKAGLVLAITGAGGAFGHILKETHIGSTLGQMMSGLQLGIWLPFLLAVVLKTAQGSSTVAVITAASLVAPMLPQLGLDGEWDTVCATLAMGAGSMAVSYSNDSFFWVVTRFSDLLPGAVFRVYSSATVVMALVAQLIVWGCSMAF